MHVWVAKASHPHRTWTAVSSSVPQLKFATSSGSKKRNPDMYAKSLVREPPSMFPQPGSLWREMLHLQNQWCIHSFIPVRVCRKEPSHIMWGKFTVTIHGFTRRQKAYIQWGAAWFPKAIVYDAAITTPVPCSLQHDTFHLGLGRPEPHYPVWVIVTLNGVYPPHLILPPTWPRVEYKSTYPWGTNERLDLWEAPSHCTDCCTCSMTPVIYLYSK
jgi:hypothetical protein